MNSSAPTPTSKDLELWTIRSLLTRHKRAALGVAAVVAVMVAIILVALLSPKAGAVGDRTTCSQWGSANQDQEVAYARLYVREHGPLPGGGTSAARVIAAINDGCTHAYGEDVSDTVTVVQAISGNF